MRIIFLVKIMLLKQNVIRKIITKKSILLVEAPYPLICILVR